MKIHPANSIKFAAGLLAGILSTAAIAQSGSLRSEHPELANLYNAFDVTQAQLFDAIAQINADPATQQARNELRMELDMMANADMEMGHGDGAGMVAPMTGPYGGDRNPGAGTAIRTVTRRA